MYLLGFVRSCWRAAVDIVEFINVCFEFSLVKFSCFVRVAEGVRTWCLAAFPLKKHAVHCKHGMPKPLLLGAASESS